MDEQRLKQILEAALLAAGRPLAIADLERLFSGDSEAPPRDAIRRALAQLAEDWAGRSLALQEVASGFRAQVRNEFEPWIARLWDEKPPRYSRALLETLAIIAYRQPITRSKIEEIRGVSVSTQIMRTLSEREWVRLVGHREAPGKPAMYGTTRQFLDHFNLKTLDQLPPLGEVRELDGQYPELELEGEPSGSDGDAAEAGRATETRAGTADAPPAEGVDPGPAGDDASIETAGAGVGDEGRTDIPAATDSDAPGEEAERHDAPGTEDSAATPAAATGPSPQAAGEPASSGPDRHEAPDAGTDAADAVADEVDAARPRPESVAAGHADDGDPEPEDA